MTIMNRLQRLEQTFPTNSVPVFEIGDTVRVHVKVIEGEKERVQVFEGVVIARKGKKISETFTVRKISYGVGVERVFPSELSQYRENRRDAKREGAAGKVVLSA